MNYIVYKHTTPSGKIYIGITSKKAKYRWGKNGNKYKKNKHFYSAILKYGWENIEHEILFENLTKEEACQKEIELIAYYRSNEREFGYNKSIGGEINMGYHLSDETKKQLVKCKKVKDVEKIILFMVRLIAKSKEKNGQKKEKEFRYQKKEEKNYMENKLGKYKAKKQKKNYLML